MLSLPFVFYLKKVALSSLVFLKKTFAQNDMLAGVF